MLPRDDTQGLYGALADAGGEAAPTTAAAGLRKALDATLVEGVRQLGATRSGHPVPVEVGLAHFDARLHAVLPLPATFGADPDAIDERAWLLCAATLAALVELAGLAMPLRADDLALRAGARGPSLRLAMPAGCASASDLAELAPLAFDERAAGIDRLRARAVVLPAAVLAPSGPLRRPIGVGHPLRVAEAVARLGGDPVDPVSVDAHEDAVLALLGEKATARAARPHDDEDPSRRIARRILQRLAGMGKWGGYHTDFAHLSRGFKGNERALAQAVGEALIAAGLLVEKPSVGQRHVFLDPRHAAEIHALIDTGTEPSGLSLPR